MTEVIDALFNHQKYQRENERKENADTEIRSEMSVGYSLLPHVPIHPDRRGNGRGLN